MEFIRADFFKESREDECVCGVNAVIVTCAGERFVECVCDVGIDPEWFVWVSGIEFGRPFCSVCRGGGGMAPKSVFGVKSVESCFFRLSVLCVIDINCEYLFGLVRLDNY